MDKTKCIKCKHEWLARVIDPKECPHCKSRDWKVKKEVKEDVF